MIYEHIKSIVNSRIREFETLGEEGEVTFDFRPFLNMEVYSNKLLELAFCLSVPNEKAINGLIFQKKLSFEDFNDISRIKYKLKNSGIRYYERKATYIYIAAKKFKEIDSLIKKFDANYIRKYLVKNFKGIGMKVASHYLRNLGFKNVGIIDRHVMRFLYKNGYIKSLPKNINYDDYVKLEEILIKISKEYDLTLAELDLYIWYNETGMILK